MKIRNVLIALVAVMALSLSSAVAVSTSVDNTQVMYDSYGQRMDAHDGDLLQTEDGTIYVYGTSYGCGFTLNQESPFCGVRVYTTKDLKNFTPAGAVGGSYAFNHLDQKWQDLCTFPNFGCYRPHVVQRPSDGKYIMWINSHGDAGYKVLISDSPAGPFVDTGANPVLAIKPPTGGLRYGDHDLTVDGNSVYLSYTAIWPEDNRHDIIIERLNTSLTSGTGRYTRLDEQMVEAPSLFKGPNGRWYITYSNPAKPYIVTGTAVESSTSPLGPFGGKKILSANSCSGQPALVAEITSPVTGAQQFVYGTDRWVSGEPNQAFANNYYGRLSFTATDINTHSCQGGWTL